jgi:hypothetical protein
MSKECFGSKSSQYEYDPDEIILNSQVSKTLQKEYKKDSEYSKILLLGKKKRKLKKVRVPVERVQSLNK